MLKDRKLSNQDLVLADRRMRQFWADLIRRKGWSLTQAIQHSLDHLQVLSVFVVEQPVRQPPQQPPTVVSAGRRRFTWASGA